MKALAVFPSAREVRIVEQDKPRIEAPTQVLLRTHEIGICGTDREICAFEYGEPPKGEDRLVLGHESIGEVVDRGPGVRTLKPGDLAVPLVRRPCGRPDCYPCRAGRQDFCTTGAYRERGIKGAENRIGEILCHFGTGRRKAVKAAQGEGRVKSQRLEAAVDTVFDAIFGKKRWAPGGCHDLAGKPVNQCPIGRRPEQAEHDPALFLRAFSGKAARGRRQRPPWAMRPSPSAGIGGIRKS